MTEVKLARETRYRRVDFTTKDFKDVTRGDVIQGMYVSVSNTRNGDEIVARYVFVANDRETMNAAWAKKHDEDAKKAAASQPATAPAEAAAPAAPVAPAASMADSAAMAPAAAEMANPPAAAMQGTEPASAAPAAP